MATTNTSVTAGQTSTAVYVRQNTQVYVRGTGSLSWSATQTGTFARLGMDGNRAFINTPIWIKLAATTDCTLTIDFPDESPQDFYIPASSVQTDPVAANRPADVIDVETAIGILYNSTVAVAASRALTNADDGKTLECTAGSISLTVPAGLRVSFGCAVIPNGTTSIVSSGGALLNGATTTLTRAAASNAAFGLISRVSATDSYVVTGA